MHLRFEAVQVSVRSFSSRGGVSDLMEEKMFYVKERISDALEVSIDIGKNVYCKCPNCGAEVAVDLDDVCADGNVDLSITSVLCDRCAHMIFGGRRNE